MHFEQQVFRFAAQAHVNPRGLGVPRDVGQRLLQDAEHSGSALLIPLQLLDVAGELRLDAGARLELLQLPFDGRLQAEVLQELRAHLRDDLPHCAHALVHVGLDKVQRLQQLFRRVVQRLEHLCNALA